MKFVVKGMIEMKKHEFNAKGMACPLPVVQTKKLLAEYDVVETTVDNFIATENLTKLAEQLNYNIDVKKVSDEEYVVTVSNPAAGGEVPGKEAAEEKSPVLQLKDDSYIVVVNKQIMGHGSEELGKKLMKAFLYTLSEQEVLPKKVIFYNGGVLLVDKTQSHVLEELNTLQENGVEIMSCGACIDYYKVDMAVGSTSNMYFIVEEMRAADRVVRP
jgi:selenium metabolism protein yedF